MTAPRHALFGGLRARLLAGLLVVALLGAAGMALLTEDQRRSASDALEDTSLLTQAQALAQRLTVSPAGRFAALSIPERWRKAYATPGAAFFTIYDASGRVAARSSNLGAPLAPQPPATGRMWSPLALIGPKQDLTLTLRGAHGAVIVVSRSNPGALNEADPDPLEDFQPLILLTMVLAAGLLAAWLVAGWSLRPLRRASVEASAIGPDQLDRRITLDGLPAEIAPMASAVNGALDRVSRAYAAERRFTTDAAHALRTPVAVMDLRLQRAAATGEPDLAALRGDLKEIAHLVSGLLNLARADQTGQPRETINLARLLREVAASMQPAFDVQGRSLVVKAPEVLEIAADDRRVRDLVVALLDNALVHGAGLVIATLSSSEDGSASLRVKDEGAGVPPELWERVFERFTKLDAASSGAGLGLSIVRQTALALGGDARFAGPATVEVTFR